MTISRFEVFTTVVDLGSFTKAAKKLNMTQPAVSHAVSSLESEWDVSLLIRDKKKGLRLTEIGQKTVIHMREIVSRIEKINQEIAFASNIEKGTVRLGIFYSASACLLPKILAQFQRKYPNIEFVLFEGTYEEIIDWLESGVVDVGFIIETNETTAYETLPLVKDDIVVAFSERHFLNKYESVTIKDIANEPFIMPKGMYAPYILEIFKDAHVEPNICFEVQDCTTIANLVKEGLGITIGSKLFLKTHSQLKHRDLAVKNVRDISLAFNSSKTSPAVQAFLKEARRVFDR